MKLLYKLTKTLTKHKLVSFFFKTKAIFVSKMLSKFHNNYNYNYYYYYYYYYFDNLIYKNLEIYMLKLVCANLFSYWFQEACFLNHNTSDMVNIFNKFQDIEIF